MSISSILRSYNKPGPDLTELYKRVKAAWQTGAAEEFQTLIKQQLSHCPYEVCGFFEELQDPRTSKMFGSRSIPFPTRPIGSDGRMTYKLTQNVEVTKGLKQRTIKASSKKPVEVIGTIQILCGKAKHNL